MNVVYFKVDHPPHERQTTVHYYLKSVQLLRDNAVVADLGDLKITNLPAWFYTVIPTGFSKIEFSMQNRSQLRIECYAGYLRTGEYIVSTPGGEITLPFNTLSGLWTLNKQGQVYIDHQEFMARNYSLIRPAKIPARGVSVF